MRIWSALFIMIILLASCGKPDLSPRDIKDTDKCVVCNMMIDHPEQAAQMVFNNEEHIIFDDIGCMMTYYKEQNNKDNIGMMYIKDYKHNKWIDAKKAYYLYHKDVWTPMNYGVAAFKNKEDHNQYAKKVKGAKPLSFEDLKTFKWGVH